MSGRRFFSHVERGLRRTLSGADAVRPTLRVTLEGRTLEASPRLALAGPEAVRGLAPGAIRGRFPGPDANDFRAGALPYVEFVDPGLPWSMTRGRASGGRLRPFLGLLCVTRERVTIDDDALPLPRATIALEDADAPLPPVDDFTSMAHVEDPDGGEGGGEDRRPGPRAFSRVLCPQRLVPHREHLALLVPLFASGRATGLDDAAAAVDADAAAWNEGTRAIVLPLYDRFAFRTGAGRGAEDLLRELRAVPPAGRNRTVAVDGPLVASLAPGLLEGRDADDVRVERRAVFTAEENPPARRDGFRSALAPRGPDGRRRLPLPVYGAEHGAEQRAAHADAEEPIPDTPSWLGELNLDPSLRVMAGHGAAIVRAKQDDIVGFVLERAGELERANAVLARARAAVLVTRRIHRRLERAPASRTGGLRSLGALAAFAAPAAARTALARGSADGDSLAERLDGTLVGALAAPELRRRLGDAGAPSSSDATSAAGSRFEALVRAVDATRFAPVIAGASPIDAESQDFLDATTTLAQPIEPLDPRSALSVLGDDNDLPVRETPGAATALARFRERSEEDARRADGAPRDSDRPPLSRGDVLHALDPAETVPPRVNDRIEGAEIPDFLPRRLVLPEPVWPYPLVEELLARDPDAIGPALAELPPDGVMALELDTAAVEALMVGANHELLRELRWRGVAVPRAISPVRRLFPAPDAGRRRVEDSDPIADWGDRALGAGRVAGIGLVALVRSALFRRFPGTVVTLYRARWNDAGRRTLDPNTVIAPRITGSLGGDSVYLGFDVPLDEMVGDPDPGAGRAGGFLVFEQPDTGTSFGLNATPGGTGRVDMERARLGRAARPVARRYRAARRGESRGTRLGRVERRDGGDPDRARGRARPPRQRSRGTLTPCLPR